MSLLGGFQKNQNAPLSHHPQRENRIAPFERETGRYQSISVIQEPVRSEAEVYHAYVEKERMGARYFLFFINRRCVFLKKYVHIRLYLVSQDTTSYLRQAQAWKFCTPLS